MVTRLALHCVCNHDNVMSFKIILYGRSLGTPCRRLLDITLPSICSCSETQEFVSSVTLLANVFFLRRQLTDQVLLELGDQYKSFELGYQVPGRPSLSPCTVASGHPELTPCMAALGPLLQ